MDTNTELQDRAISPQAYGVRPYVDNCDDIEALCVDGRKPGEVLRDLVAEAIYARRNSRNSQPETLPLLEQLTEQNQMLIEQNRTAAERQEQLIKQYERLLDRNTREKEALSQNLREFYGLLLESLLASILARRLAWNYVARTVLKQSGYSDEQIGKRYESEMQACIAERNEIADALEQMINDPPQADNQPFVDSKTEPQADTAPPN